MKTARFRPRFLFFFFFNLSLISICWIFTAGVDMAFFARLKLFIVGEKTQFVFSTDAAQDKQSLPWN